MTLRGIGSYLRGARLDLRPMTVLCGKNGSGKSTWLQALDLLEKSAGSDQFPFVLASERSAAHDHTNAYINTSEDAPKELQDGTEETDFGPLGTIGLDFECQAEFDIPSCQLPANRNFKSESVPQGLLWSGRCPARTRFRLRIAHPTRSGGDTPLEGLVELRVNDEHYIRFRKPAGADSYSFTCSTDFLPNSADRDHLIIRIADVEVKQDDVSKPKVIPPDGADDPTLCVELGERAISCIRGLASVLFAGYFHITSIRDPQHEAPSDRSRYVGAKANTTYARWKEFACNPVREPRGAGTGRVDQSFLATDIIGRNAASLLRNGEHNSPHQRIMSLASASARDEFNSYMEQIVKLNYDAETARLVANILNSVLHQRELFHGIAVKLEGDEFDWLLSRAAKLSDYEVTRLNRLWIESLFPEAIFHLTAMDVDYYVSFWLLRLVGITAQLSPGYLARLARFTCDDPGVHGFLLNFAKSPQVGTNIHVAEERERFSNDYFGNNSQSVSPARLSSGFHQIAPILVQAALIQQGEILAIENPEVHLHPSLQLDLTEFLIGEAGIGKIVIIETHSDLVVQRAMRAILEETLPQESVRIYFADKAKERAIADWSSSVLERIRINERGQIENWPDGFMDDDVKESRRLLDIMYGDGQPPTEHPEDS